MGRQDGSGQVSHLINAIPYHVTLCVLCCLLLTYVCMYVCMLWSTLHITHSLTTDTTDTAMTSGPCFQPAQQVASSLRNDGFWLETECRKR